MKLSIVILCWNDRAVIGDCLRSIYATARSRELEVIVSDNGSTDGSIDLIRETYPQVRVIENRRNLRFARANNVGIRACRGKYILILNPDTIIHSRTLDKVIGFADDNPGVAAVGCRVLNADGSYQVSARPFASIGREWIAALYARWLGYLSESFVSDMYVGWSGTTERLVDWITGCFMLIRADVLQGLNGFDEQFFYYYEDMDLCRRIWLAGHTIAFIPDVTITHLKGHSTNRRLPPVAFALDSQVTRYRYYFKYDGIRGVRRARSVALARVLLRYIGYASLQLISPEGDRRDRLNALRTLLQWHWRVDPVRLVKYGEEPFFGNTVPGRVLER